MRSNWLSILRTAALGFAALWSVPNAGAAPVQTGPASLYRVDTTGVITQAPEKNPFDVSVGDQVKFSAVIDFGEFCDGMPTNLCTPEQELRNSGSRVFSANFTIGNATYQRPFELRTFFTESGSSSESLGISNGLLNDLVLRFIPADCSLGSSCPTITFNRSLAFSTGDMIDDTSCNAGDVCGILNAAGLHAVPEPASGVLLLTALAALGASSRRSLRRQHEPSSRKWWSIA